MVQVIHGYKRKKKVSFALIVRSGDVVCLQRCHSMQGLQQMQGVTSKELEVGVGKSHPRERKLPSACECLE